MLPLFCLLGCSHLFLADERPVHGAGGVVPAPDGLALQHLCLHNVAAVLVDVVVRLALFPETTKKARENSSQNELGLLLQRSSADRQPHTLHTQAHTHTFGVCMVDQIEVGSTMYKQEKKKKKKKKKMRKIWRGGEERIKGGGR